MHDGDPNGRVGRCPHSIRGQRCLVQRKVSIETTTSEDSPSPVLDIPSRCPVFLLDLRTLCADYFRNWLLLHIVREGTLSKKES